MNISEAPQGGGKALRAMRACEKLGPSGEKMGSDPHLGAILAFLGHRKGVVSTRSINTGPFLFKPLLHYGDPPCGIYTLDKSIRHNSRVLSAGFAE